MFNVVLLGYPRNALHCAEKNGIKHQNDQWRLLEIFEYRSRIQLSIKIQTCLVFEFSLYLYSLNMCTLTRAFVLLTKIIFYCKPKCTANNTFQKTHNGKNYKVMISK